MSGLYLHIPFCKQACSYCDFYFVTWQKHKEDFVESLIREIHSYQNTEYSREPVKTIYFGGGTPSLLSVAQVERIINALNHSFDLQPEEVTFEMNPDDVSREYLSGLLQAGIDRASMGVQSTQQELLDFMHRAHDSSEALRCLQILKDSGLKVFTVDLIYGNPGQSLESLNKDLDAILEFDPPHISAYSLTIEPRTRLGKQVELGRLQPPADDMVAEHFDLVVQRLGQAGIEQYEVSNFARPGKEARHNSGYWNHQNYLGLGPGAHSFWWKEGENHATRWSHERDLKKYLDHAWEKPFEKEDLGMEKLAEERLMLGLRTREGVDINTLRNTYSFEFSPAQMDYLHRLEEQDKAIVNDRISLKPDGLRIADTILLDLLTI